MRRVASGLMIATAVGALALAPAVASAKARFPVRPSEVFNPPAPSPTPSPTPAPGFSGSVDERFEENREGVIGLIRSERRSRGA